jgi:branched-chain amino acid transport system substrate-binding protein
MPVCVKPCGAAEGVKASGGEVLGAARHPLGTAHYASFLLQAQASGADVIGIAMPATISLRP